MLDGCTLPSARRVTLAAIGGCCSQWVTIGSMAVGAGSSGTAPRDLHRALALVAVAASGLGMLPGEGEAELRMVDGGVFERCVLGMAARTIDRNIRDRVRRIVTVKTLAWR